MSGIHVEVVPMPDSRSRPEIPTVWLADLTYTAQGAAAESFPYAVGCLAEYVAARCTPTAPIRLFKFPEALIAALEEGSAPAVLGFSNYIWNSRLSLALASAAKRLSPTTTIVFGGPHYSLYPQECERFLRANPVIDFYVEKEGETAFAELLVALNEGADAVHGRLAGVHSIDASGRVHLPPSRERMTDIMEIPSPYLSGALDEFFGPWLVPTLQTNRGCPFSCTFCVEGSSYYSRVRTKHIERVRDELFYMGARMQEQLRRGARNELLITDSNFGMFTQDIEVCRAIGECQDRYGWPRYVNATTGKNRRERVLTAIKHAQGAIELTGSVQTLDVQVLANIKRANIDAQQMIDLALQAQESGTGSYSEVILGLPGDTEDAHRRTVCQLVDAGFGGLRMYQLCMLPGSELASPKTREEFGMQTAWRVLPRCFGDYTVGGEHIVVAETDEICIAQDSISFDAYLQARMFDLLVAVFHNGGVFRPFEQVAILSGAHRSDWLRAVSDAAPGTGLDRVMADYLDDTKRQLWPTAAALLEHIQAPGVLETYVTGERGNNLLYTYRARAYMEVFDDLVAIAATALRAVAPGIDDACPRGSIVNDAAAYCSARMKDVIVAVPVPDKVVELSHDIFALDQDPHPAPLERYELPAPVQVSFSLSQEQLNVLSHFADVFGPTPSGRGRMLTRVIAADLRRSGAPVEAEAAVPAAAAVTQ